MIKHILLFKFKENTPAGEIKKIIDKFYECKNKVAGFKDIEYGENISEKKHLSRGFNYAVIMSFTDKATIEEYNKLDEHRDARELQKPYLEDILVFDI